MPKPVKPPKRAYRAPRREAAAAQTREAILDAARERFEAGGWAGTTIPAIAGAAGVSPKTIEAGFATKAALLAAVVRYAIRGDTAEVPIARRTAAQAIEAAPDAATMLDLHAEMSGAINARAARIAFVVETAASADPRVTALWQQMNDNLRFGARWAAQTLISKPGRRRGLELRDAEQVFLVAMEWGTYRTLTGKLGMTPEQSRAWIKRYYKRMLLPG
jgi:AcrR family transcriptional regulator